MNPTEWFLGASPAVVYAAVGLLVGAEGVGLPMPGETALVAGLLLAGAASSRVTLVGVALVAVLGAVVGDSLGFAIGRRYGQRLLDTLSRRLSRHFSPTHRRYAEHLYGRHGVKAVVGGRFVAVLRMLSGPMAGTLGLPYRRFLLADLLGVCLWAGAVTAVVTALGVAADRWLAHAGWVLFAVAACVALVAGRFMAAAFHRRAQAFAVAVAGGAA